MNFPGVFSDAQVRILTDLHERDSQERRQGIREALSLKALSPAVAQLLYLLILQKSAKTIVEFGASHGYSTIHLAAALPDGIDFVLVDYGLPAFAPAFDKLRDRLVPGCIIFIDGGPDGWWEADDVRSFKTLLENDPAFVVSILPMHKQQLIAVRVGE
jgi:predicted O-methyltransferase YrrM